MKKITIISIVGAVIAAFSGVLYLFSKKVSYTDYLKEVYMGYYSLSNKWISNLHNNINLSGHLKSKGYKSIGVYGLGTLGSLFLNEIQNSGINVEYIIDKGSENFYDCDINIINIGDIKQQKNIDAIIVTPIAHFNEINNELSKLNLKCDVISLEQIVSDAMM